MKDFSPMQFFSLEKFAHAVLFKGEFVWQALQALLPYLEKQKLGKIESPIVDGVYLQNKETISIGTGCHIEPGAFIEGPCIIGPKTTIRHGAYIRGGVIVGSDAVIGHATEIKHSILLNGAKAPHLNYVGDSILGADVNLGAGAVLANFRADHAEIVIHKKFSTGMNKLGAIIGDKTQLGCNAVTNPGTLIGPESFCLPCLSIGGVFPQKSQIRESTW
ncbi:MAG: UDP-N-acetylglucosamine diphosphorylase [Verrucomicrobia bacterium]|nr:UDP-N-acetylglucosamine diphosphorylase [Verrucomicrobiota bacterium]